MEEEAGCSSGETAARMALHGSKMPSLAEEPAVDAPPMPLVGAVLELSPWDYEEEEDEEDLADEPLSDDDEDDDEVVYESEDDHDSDGYYDEDEEDALEFWEGEEPGNGGVVEVAATVLEFLGRLTPFATAQCTVGFMRLAAEEAEEPGQEGGEIVVHYRYTRFWWGQGADVREVEPKWDQAVRFLVPSPAAAVDEASSLRLAGAWLASRVYPAGFRVQLQALWASLVAVALAVRDVPPRAARLVVTVDAAILRRRDRTPERMAFMRSFLPELARDADTCTPRRRMDLRLPAPVCCGDDDEDQDGTRAAKRGGEECAICYEAMEGGLVAWPRCSHVFHGKCLEQLLVKMKHCCPLCRSPLKPEVRARLRSYI
ncbi:hypothetical protein ACP70R_007391 [Stipagrostis hirtigluma subsp. patula]